MLIRSTPNKNGSYPNPNSSFYQEELQNAYDTAEILEKSTDESMLRKYFQAKYSEAIYRTAIVSNENITPELIDEIIEKATNENVYRFALNNPKTERKTLEKILSKTKSSETIRLIKNHQKFWPDFKGKV